MISAEKGHLEVVRALVEAGGRELVMLTMHCGASCLSIARQANHSEVCRVLEMECQNALVVAQDLDAQAWLSLPQLATPSPPQ